MIECEIAAKRYVAPPLLSHPYKLKLINLKVIRILNAVPPEGCKPKYGELVAHVSGS